jgi:hypothetical protein
MSETQRPDAVAIRKRLSRQCRQETPDAQALLLDVKHGSGPIGELVSVPVVAGEKFP